MSLHITSLTYVQYILIKLIQHHGPCFLPKHRGMELLVTSGFDSTARYAEEIWDETSWRNGRIDQTMMMYDVEMEQTICGKMETSSILPLFELQLTQIWQRKTKYLFNIYPKTAAWIWMTQKIPNILEDLHLSDGSKKLQHGEPWLGNCLGETMELSSRWCSEEKEGWQKHKTLPNTQV